MSLPHLTIAYMTFRRASRVEWFKESLRRELEHTPLAVTTLIINRYAADNPGHVLPKPSVWQGASRLTKQDYFAASQARNTAICLAKDGWIAFVDDLSILMPGWLAAVRRAMEGGYIVFGAYKKVFDLHLVDDPQRASYRPHPGGVDSRWNHGRDGEPVLAAGSWLFGCSLAAPVEALLSINGWEEDCDSLGSEDSIAGIMLGNRGHTFRYDRSMLTLESEEGHGSEPSLVRFDKGVSPNDKSHAMLGRSLRSTSATNYFPGGIRAERDRVLRGEPFTIPTEPTCDWYDKQPLSEL